VKGIRLLPFAGLFFLQALVHADDYAQPQDQTPIFHSPKGQFDIRFQPEERRLYATPYERSLAPSTKSQVYSISFYLPGHDEAASMMYFTDIERPNQKFPTPIATLMKEMVWSPEEDFVVLPREAWPTVDGEVIPRQAVLLRTEGVWKYSDFPLQTEGMVWLNPLQAIGNSVQGCRHEVEEFDGGSGRAQSYQTADPPVGYEILSHDGDRVVLKKVLGDCATDTDRKEFHADCVIMNVSFGRREIGSCPP
jgi:hypothetical protein